MNTKPFANLTKAEAKARIIAHFTKDPRFGVEDGDCLYRASEGRKCAVGCLIPDELYNPAWEHQIGIASALGASPDLALFLEKAQEIHDRTSADGTMADFLKYMEALPC